MSRDIRRVAFSIIELLVVIAIIGILIAILLPALERVRHKGYIDACASNLRQIGQALQMYANDNHGNYPRTTYLPGAQPVAGTGGPSANPFGAGGPQFNDVSAVMFLLLRTQKITPKIVICPYNDVFAFEPERADVSRRSNFTNYRLNFGYSIANPYPDDAAVRAGYKWTDRLRAEFALAADVNGGGPDLRGDDVTFPSPNSATRDLRRGNSPNHENEGQNVLYGDGHVVYQLTPFCGVNNDNIYANRNRQIVSSPVDKDDSVLLPTDD